MPHTKQPMERTFFRECLSLHHPQMGVVRDCKRERIPVTNPRSSIDNPVVLWICSYKVGNSCPSALSMIFVVLIKIWVRFRPGTLFFLGFSGECAATSNWFHSNKVLSPKKAIFIPLTPITNKYASFVKSNKNVKNETRE